MENEEFLEENTESVSQNQTGDDIPTTDILYDEENLETGEISVEELPQTPSSEIPPVLEDNYEDEMEIENGEIENDENIVEIENGSENVFGDVSGNDIDFGSYYDTLPNYYVTNVYEVVEEVETPLWIKDFSDYTTTEMLLFLIFILLFVQFVHKLFKGSHWFKW